MEQWKIIEGFERYEVSDMGNVRNIITGKVLKAGTNRHGYLRVVLCGNGKPKSQMVHRLVANAFISNPNNKPQVNHINGDKFDNRVENLEWATSSENIIHANRVLKRNPGGVPRKKVRCIETGIIYASTVEAAKAVNGQPVGIVRACNGKIRKHKKLHWQFA